MHHHALLLPVHLHLDNSASQLALAVHNNATRVSLVRVSRVCSGAPKNNMLLLGWLRVTLHRQAVAFACSDVSQMKLHK